jgi:predicted metal-dependent hydrolase
MNKLIRVSVFLGALLLVLAVMALLGVRSGDRRALQKYQTELAAKGEKLTFAELTRGRQTNAVDSHALVINAWRKLNDVRIDPGLLKQRGYIRPGQASVAWRQASPTLTQSAGSSGSAGWKEFAAQMKASQGALQEIREALKNPAADLGPYTNMIVGRRFDFVTVESVAECLTGAAENELHQGRLEESLQDLEALASLARMERDEYTLAAQVARVCVASKGLAATWDALQAPAWTELQLARLQKAWEPMDLVDAVVTGFIGARADGYELFAFVRRSSGAKTARFLRHSSSPDWSPTSETLEELAGDYLFLPSYKLTRIDADELFYLQTVQECIAALRLLQAHRPWPEAKQALTNAGARVTALSSELDRFRHLFSLLANPYSLSAGTAAVSAETERQMTLAAIALKRFQLRHGQLPPSLEALVPVLLSAVPYDYMSAKPLCYRLKPDGSYVLYSVGLDGKDDGGDPSLAPSASPGLWGGRDAVWPSPAAEPEEAHRQADQ